MSNTENKEFWVDENLNPNFHADFKLSIDDDVSWKMTNELKYTAFVEKNYDISEEDLKMISTYLRSLGDNNRLNTLSKVMDKNYDKLSVIKKLIYRNPKTLSENLTIFYIEDYKIDKKFVKVHVDTDIKEYLDGKERNDKLDRILNL